MLLFKTKFDPIPEGHWEFLTPNPIVDTFIKQGLCKGMGITCGKPPLTVQVVYGCPPMTFFDGCKGGRSLKRHSSRSM